MSGPRPSVPLVAGRGGPWPYAGLLRGEFVDGERSVAWAGRIGHAVAHTPELAPAWRASRAVHRALLRGGLPDGDPRHAATAMWARLEPLKASLEPGIAATLSLLLVARAGAELAVSATGLGALWALDDVASPWVGEGHPLLGAPGLPERRPGALTIASGAPRFLVGAPYGDPALYSPDPADWLAACGVHA